MLKRYKLLITLIILTALGVVLVLSGWLYGSYQNRKDLFLSTAERGMFNVIQDVYQNTINKNGGDSTALKQRMARKSFVAYLHQRYPSINFDSLRTAFEDWRSKTEDKAGSFDKKEDGPSQIIPPYLFRDFEFTPDLLDTVKRKFESALDEKGINIGFDVELLTLKREDITAFRGYTKKNKLMWTRPTLVNPEKGQFVVVKFDKPWRHLLFDMGWQLLVAVLLVASLVGSFAYLILTIFKQNKLAELRKNFVNNMTHELKTPLSTVMAAIESIQSYGAKDDQRKMELYLQISKNELEHLSDMIEKVLQMDIDERGGMSLNHESVDLLFLLQHCVDTARLGAKKDVNVSLESESSSVLVLADEAHLRNVFNNLLDNAIKYAGAMVEIVIRVKDIGQEIEIEIQDNGKGIPRQYHREIFEMFFRVPEGNLYDVKGFGLGLSYVRQIVQQHGGRIAVSSDVGKGSIFTVTLPKE
ncbi:sensor histidine kinase [Sphingobacterium sp. SYP-B4668]|uniref:sensor histidine kinase n=1 Tax=Sphingobacterium sp. SYP-B4668 TaxID=2996035 RepID=UPI0005323AF5|nr:HAMP domain-containing sensor histidine kinase [Sphingobacterium sp. SYP-B4668]